MTEEHKIIPIDSIDLDFENPRIRRFLEYTPNPTAEQIYLALGFGSSESDSSGTTTFRSLRESIRESKGIIYPIIVRTKPDGKYLAIDGNTRLAIYKEFRDEQGPGKGWDEIPAIIRDGLKDHEVHAIRLQAHLVGPRPWDPYSKAKYLDFLRNFENLPMATIEALCGGRRRELSDLIESYNDMEKYYRPVIADESAFDITRFSAFVELQKPGIKEAILTAGFTKEDFAKWVVDQKIQPLNTVRALPRILANKEARQKFLKSGAREALKQLDLPSTPSSLDNIPLEHLARALTERIEGIAYIDVKALKSDNASSKAQALFAAVEALQELCTEITKNE